MIFHSLTFPNDVVNLMSGKVMFDRHYCIDLMKRVLKENVCALDFVAYLKASSYFSRVHVFMNMV